MIRLGHRIEQLEKERDELKARLDAALDREERLKSALRSMPKIMTESLFEITAFMGIPEERRKAVITENVSNIEFIINKVLN